MDVADFPEAKRNRTNTSREIHAIHIRGVHVPNESSCLANILLFRGQRRFSAFPCCLHTTYAMEAPSLSLLRLFYFPTFLLEMGKDQCKHKHETHSNVSSTQLA